MELVNILIIAQIAVSVAMIIVIILQNRGEGMGALFTGSMGGGESFRTRRGLEKFLYNATIVLALVFIVLSFMIVKLS